MEMDEFTLQRIAAMEAAFDRTAEAVVLYKDLCKVRLSGT